MDDRLFGLINKGTTIRQLQLVLESGVNLNVYNERQETPLMTSMINIHDPKRRKQIVQILLLYHANINCRNLRGQTPFMYACILKQTDILDILVKDKIIECNLQDFEGNTALMYACALMHIEVVRCLVEAHEQGSIELDPYISNNEEATAMDYAIDSKLDEMVELIKSIMLGQSKNTINTIDKAFNLRMDENNLRPPKQKKRNLDKQIKRLAGAVEHRNDNTNVLVWKESDEGKPKVVTSRKNTCSNISLNRSQTHIKDMIPSKTSIVNVHLPRAHEDYDDGILPPAATMDTVDRITLNQFVTIDDQVPSTSGLQESKPRKPRRKKSRRKRSHIQTDDFEVGELIDKNVHERKEFGEEIMFCNKIYGTDLYPCDNGEGSEEFKVDDMIANITNKAVSNYNCATSNQADATSHYETQKLDYLKISAKDRAKLLSRAFWSIYGASLPPIPITTATLDRVMNGIAELRKYLSRAKYQPGRLLSLDPELWCIIESMRTELKPD